MRTQWILNLRSVISAMHMIVKRICTSFFVKIHIYIAQDTVLIYQNSFVLPNKYSIIGLCNISMVNSCSSYLLFFSCLCIAGIISCRRLFGCSVKHLCCTRILCQNNQTVNKSYTYIASVTLS